jgi:hypothetical protein
VGHLQRETVRRNGYQRGRSQMNDCRDVRVRDVRVEADKPQLIQVVMRMLRDIDLHQCAIVA